jgi:beta-glucosidase
MAEGGMARWASPSGRVASLSEGRRVGTRRRSAAFAALALLATLVAGTARPALAAPPPTESAAASCPWVTQGNLTVAQRVREVEAKATKSQLASLLYLQTGKTFGSFSPAIGALCIPQIVNMSARAGDRTIGPKWKDTTELPAPINIGASFDPSLAYAYGAVIGDQSREQGVALPMAPMINIVRTSDFGRTFETEGEDPYLMAGVGVPETDGIQSSGDGAIVDHCCVYNQADWRGDIGGDNSVVSQSALREEYLPAWRAVITQSDPAGIMTSYNSINGVQSNQDVSLLKGILRDAWGFSGFYRTDDITSLLDQNLMVKATVSLSHGPNYQPAWVVDHLSKATIETLTGPYLSELFRFGLIQHPVHGEPGDLTAAEQEAGAQVALRASEEGTVLLRNRKGVLPLPTTGTIALIGSDGGTPLWAGQGSGYVAPPKLAVDAEAGLKAALGSRLDWVPISQGPKATQSRPYAGTDPSAADIARAVAAAKKSKEAIVVASEWGSEWWDQSTLELNSAQQALIQAVAAANPRTIVVLDAGQGVVMPWKNQVAGIVDTWFPGEEAGPALAAILTGQVNPSGHLPITFPTSDDAQPVHAGTSSYDPPQPGNVDYSEGVDVGYRWYAAHGVTPEYSFGYGLSYSRFRLSGLHIQHQGNDNLVVTTTVSNLSARSGVEVPQLYLSQPGIAGEPPIELRGFDRITVPGHRSAVATFNLSAGDLAHWVGTSSGTWKIQAGNVILRVGTSATSLPLSAKVYLKARSGVGGLSASY